MSKLFWHGLICGKNDKVRFIKIYRLLIVFSSFVIHEFLILYLDCQKNSRFLYGLFTAYWQCQLILVSDKWSLEIFKTFSQISMWMYFLFEKTFTNFCTYVFWFIVAVSFSRKCYRFHILIVYFNCIFLKYLLQ